ncbi:unnamed protein product [Phytophthora fragariaefolia]|uniref:Unnamed protein product n=1 Tax=Phytophthora fragariaefolia TaxID=1490495 RepID=A0A9W6YBP0_9STRA|nr:unnamed protein product [Phytophthora fragariaefolia]
MLQLKQSRTQENEDARRDVEDLVAREMAQWREQQEDATERLHEEMDEIRSGVSALLKDMHRLKERTKYLVPSMARVGPRSSPSNANGPPPPPQTAAVDMSLGGQAEERRRSPPRTHLPSAGYSITMAARQCQDELPHFEHGYDDDCYCPGVTMPSQMEARYINPDRPRSARSSNSSPLRSDEEVCPLFSPDRRAVQPCESPHYSSRSSSLSDRLSVYGGTRPHRIHQPPCFTRASSVRAPASLGV